MLVPYLNVSGLTAPSGPSPQKTADTARAMPEIIVKLGDKFVSRHVFDKDVLSVGRARDNDIVLENLSVSRNHCRIRRQDGKFILTDLNSANGTLVNSVRITKTELAEGDIVQVGKHLLIFTLQDGLSSSQVGDIAIDPGSAAPAVSGSQSGLVPVSQELEYQAPPGEPSMLVVQKGKQSGQKFRVTKWETSVGRAPENDVRLHDWFVSKRHAVIIRTQQGGWLLRDLQSWRGTQLNGQPVKTDQPLKDGDEIVMGSTTLRFFALVPPGTTFEQDIEPQLEGVDAGDLSLGNVDSESRNRIAAAAAAAPISTGLGDPASGPLSAKAKGQVDGDPKTSVPPPSGMAKSAAGAPPAEPSSSMRIPGSKPADESGRMAVDDLERLEALAEGTSIAGDALEEMARQEWEGVQLEQMSMSGDWVPGSNQPFLMTGDHRRLEQEELAAVTRPGPNDIPALPPDPSDDEVEVEALFGGPLPDEDPGIGGFGSGGNSSVLRPVAPAPVASASSSAILMGAAETGESYYASGSARNLSEEEKEKLTQLWTRALRNRDLLIRRHAARELKRLTGKTYDWQREHPGT